MKPLLLDTHVALWSSLGTLEPTASVIVNTASRASTLLLSPISAWEIGMLFRKERLGIADSVEDLVRDLFAAPGVVVAAMTPAIACAAGMLGDGFHGDPADRIIVASAIAYGAELMTRDKAIQRFAARSKKFRCIAC